MSFKETDLQRNSITKKLGALLPQIDPKVKWADYIPGAAIRTGTPLIAIGMDNGTVKYVDVSHKSPFKLVNEVLNAMDDYRLDTQFLTPRELANISADIANLAKDRARVAAETITILEQNDFSSEDCMYIVKRAQESGIFPQFFPETKCEIELTTVMLEDFLKTNAATFIDTQILSHLIEVQLKQKQEEQEIER